MTVTSVSRPVDTISHVIMLINMMRVIDVSVK